MEWVVNVMSRPISPEKDPVSGWVSELVWTGVENLAPTRFRSPDRPARSESLYRLSYPGSYIYMCVCVCVCIWTPKLLSRCDNNLTMLEPGRPRERFSISDIGTTGFLLTKAFVRTLGSIWPSV